MYWYNVFKKAWDRTLSIFKFENFQNILMFFAPQIIISLGLLFITGPLTNSTLWTRVLTVAAPFLFFPICLLWNFFQIPLILETENKQLIIDLEKEILDLKNKLQNKNDMYSIREKIREFIVAGENLKRLCIREALDHLVNSQLIDNFSIKVAEWNLELHNFGCKNFDTIDHAVLMACEWDAVENEPLIHSAWRYKWREINYRCLELRKIAEYFRS